MVRIGHGYDVHAFGGSKPLILAGVLFAEQPGLLAHSDGDVVLHAVCDAMLGAAALGDIGFHFPDTHSEFKNANSRHLLGSVFSLINNKNYQINNLDLTIIAQSPKMSPFVDAMRINIASDLDLQLDQVSIKATTTEGLGYIGRHQGIAVHCVCLLDNQANRQVVAE